MKESRERVLKSIAFRGHSLIEALRGDFQVPGLEKTGLKLYMKDGERRIEVSDKSFELQWAVENGAVVLRAPGGRDE